MKKIKVIISGGGTGGHIFPAIAIADSLKKKINDIDFLFIGAKGRMEMDKVPNAGYNIKGLWISGLQRKITFKNLLFPLKVLVSFVKAVFIIKKFKPDVVVGTGGYASGPTLRAATFCNQKTLIQEQNSYPGITNKLLAKKINKICVAYTETEKWFPKDKIILTGNPVRAEFAKFNNNTLESRQKLGLSTEKPVVLIIGGSLGALIINRAIYNNAEALIEKNIQIIWQTGKTFYSEALAKYANINNIKIFDFINNMAEVYAAADIIISRAGAIAISELCCVGKPVVLIPSPNVAEDHQTKNAMALVEKNAAIMIKDKDADNELYNMLISILNNEKLMSNLSKNIKAMAMPDASESIANEIVELIDYKI